MFVSEWWHFFFLLTSSFYFSFLKGMLAIGLLEKFKKQVTFFYLPLLSLFNFFSFSHLPLSLLPPPLLSSLSSFFLLPSLFLILLPSFFSCTRALGTEQRF